MSLNISQLSCNGPTITNGVNAVFTVGKTGTVTGGSFTLTFGGQTTSAIAYNATAATIQDALVALSTIGNGSLAMDSTPVPNIICTGGPFGTNVVCTFNSAAGATMGGTPQTVFTGTDSLTGGGSLVITDTTTGVIGTYRGASPNCLLLDEKNGKAYTNTGTSATPIWTIATP